jgi:hypothetical protein
MLSRSCSTVAWASVQVKCVVNYGVKYGVKYSNSLDQFLAAGNAHACHYLPLTYCSVRG